MLTDWLRSNIDYLLFAGVWTALFAIKQARLKCAARTRQQDIGEWIVLISLLVGGGVVAGFSANHWITMTVVSALLLNVGAISALLAAWCAQKEERRIADETVEEF